MNLIKSIAILFFDFLDQFIHQKRILNNLKRNKLDIKLFFDVGSHKGLYSDLILKNFSDPQIVIDKKLIDFIIKRIDRSYDKIFEFIYKIDELSLKKKNQLILKR